MIGKDSSVAYTAENLRYGEPGTVGLPEFFAMSGDKVNDLEKMDTGVMLMNLLTLRKTYSDFLRVLFDPTTWKYTSADPCGYKDYYKNKGQIAATLLPSTMNWKIWESSKNLDSFAVIVHYHGPKCETDIQPFLSEGSVRVDSFRPFLEPCSEKKFHTNARNIARNTNGSCSEPTNKLSEIPICSRKKVFRDGAKNRRQNMR